MAIDIGSAGIVGRNIDPAVHHILGVTPGGTTAAGLASDTFVAVFKALLAGHFPTDLTDDQKTAIRAAIDAAESGARGSADGVITGFAFAADGSTFTITRSEGANITGNVPEALRHDASAAVRELMSDIGDLQRDLLGLETRIPLGVPSAPGREDSLILYGLEVPARDAGSPAPVWRRIAIDLSGYARLNGATFTGPVKVPTPTEDADAANKEYVDDIAHDSSSSPNPHESSDNRRLSRLEQLTSEIALRTRTDWGNVGASGGGIAIRDVDAFTTDQATIAAYDYASVVNVVGDGTYVVIVRVPQGDAINAFRIARTGSSADPLHGVFHGGGFTAGGFDYYFMAGSLALSSGDTLTLQSVQDLITTEYEGRVPGKITDEERGSLVDLLARCLDLHVKTVSAWVAAGGMAGITAGVFARRLSTIVARGDWSNAYVVNTPEPSFSFVTAIRLPEGSNPNDYRIRWAESGTVSTVAGYPMIGNQGGFDYYASTGYGGGDVENDGNGDTLHLETHGTGHHTRFDGEVTDLTTHEARWDAHQDSPHRQAILGVNAPIGRQVYLTTAHTHPGPEHVFSVPIISLPPTGPSGTVNLFDGATRRDFTSINGPEATTDQSGFPAIIALARIAGIWQREADSDIYFAIARAGALADVIPTHLHITSAGIDYRVGLEEVQIATISGTQYRIVKTTGTSLAGLLETASISGHHFIFSMEYAAGFLQSDGTIDAGTVHNPGFYESIGGGQWRQRVRSIITELAAALDNASDAEKNALAGALQTEEQLYQDASAGTRNASRWNVVQLSREIVEADDRKIIRLHFSNVEAEFHVDILARDYRLIPHQDVAGDSDARVLSYVISGGDIDKPGDSNSKSLNISRRQLDPSSTRSMMLGSSAFGNQENARWRSHILTITLRSSI